MANAPDSKSALVAQWVKSAGLQNRSSRVQFSPRGPYYLLHLLTKPIVRALGGATILFALLFLL